MRGSEPNNNDPAGDPWDARTALGFVICIAIAVVMAAAAYYAIRYFALTLPPRIFVN